MRCSRQAFTLMEVVLVMVILIVIGALTIPTISTMFRNNGLDAAVDTIQGELTKARNKALEERREYMFAVRENTGFYRIAPVGEEYWTGNIGFVNEADFTLRENPVIEGILPEPVCFSSAAGVGNMGGLGMDWTPVAIFLADGSALEDVQFGVAVHGQPPKMIFLKAATGSVTTASLPAAGYSH